MSNTPFPQFPATPNDVAFSYGSFGSSAYPPTDQAHNVMPAVPVNDHLGMSFPLRAVEGQEVTAGASGYPPEPLESLSSDDGTDEFKTHSTSPIEDPAPLLTFQENHTLDGTSTSSQSSQNQDDCSFAEMLGGDYVDLVQEIAHYHELPRVANGKPDPRSKKRVPLSDSDRLRIKETRHVGACIRCHNQRAKCEPNDGEPGNTLLSCKTCLAVDLRSKKTIHHLPCTRVKLTGISLHRHGGLGFTTRFKHNQIKNADIPQQDRTGGVVTVYMVSGLSQTPVRLRVQAFNALPTDRLRRRYLHNGTPKEVHVPAYCLESVEKAAQEFKKYVNTYALDGLIEAVKGEHMIIRETFKMIIKVWSSMPDEVATQQGTGFQTKKPNEHKQLLTQAVQLWFAIRHEIGTSTVRGQRPADWPVIDDPNSPFRGEVPMMPRMIVAQFDSIRHECIYKSLVPKVLKLLQSVLVSNNMEVWFVAYLVTFLLLDLVSSASKDRRRWAMQNFGPKPMESRYGPIGKGSLAGFVQELHEAGAVLLLNWHYYKRVDNLLKPDWNDLRKRSIGEDELRFLRWTVNQLNLELDNIPKTPSEGCWESSLFWVCQMFTCTAESKYKWSPPEMFSTVKPSVGNVWSPPETFSTVKPNAGKD